LPPDLATESGAVTNALHGFVSMLTNIVRDHSPAALAVAFDLPGGTFRDELVEEYKAGRAETPDDLMPQFDMIREVLGALCVPVVGVPGYEADDVLATLATEARDRDCDVVVVTGDRDCFQLVEDPHVRVLYNRRGVSDYTLYDEEGIIARTGVQPRKYPMLAALRGDPSDNLPGVPGVGEKTAAKLLNTYDDIDGIYAHLDALSPKLAENLAAHEADVRANLEVIPLVRDVVMDVTVEDLSLGGWDRGIAAAAFERYELRTLWKRVSDLLDEGRLGLPRDGRLPAPGTAAPDGAPSAAGRTAERTADGSAAAAPAPAPPTTDSGQEVALSDIPPPLPAAAEPAVLEHCPVASEAVTALRALSGSVGVGTVVVTGWWDGTPGRSALRGLGLMGPGSPPVGMWLRSHQLEQATVRKALNATLAGTPVAGHNVKELLRSLLPIGIDCTGLVMDTAVAAYLLDPNQGDYSLASLMGEDLVAAPLVLPLEGGGGLLPDGKADPVALAAAEAAAVHRLVAPYRERLDAEGLGPLHDQVERPLVRVLAKMEVAGIRVDVEELRRISDELVAETKRLEAEIHRLAGHEFNVNSTPQLRTVLYDELGLTPGRKTKTGYSTDAATLESLRDDHAIVETLLGYREVEKLRSTYGESLLAEVAWDGRIHASFRQTVARTGRLSSDRPNLHNIPVRTDVGGSRPDRGLHLGSRRAPDGGLRRLRGSRRRGDQGPTGPGEDGVLRARLRHGAVRPGATALLECRGGQRDQRSVLRGVPQGEGVHGRDGRRGPPARLYPHRPRSQATTSRPRRPELPGPPGGGAPGDERRHPGVGGGHLQDRPGPPGPGPRGRRPRQPARPADPRRGHPGGAAEGGGPGGRAHAVDARRGGGPLGALGGLDGPRGLVGRRQALTAAPALWAPPRCCANLRGPTCAGGRAGRVPSSE